MAVKTRNISLPPALDEFVERAIRTYGNASSVMQAGLRALQREETDRVWRDWQQRKKKLPQQLITPDIEEQIVDHVRRLRRAEKNKVSRK